MLRRAGFSLVEVLVAMVIVALITATGMFAFKLSLHQIDRGDSLTFSEVMHFSQMKNLINSVYFYVVEKDDSLNPTLFSYEYLFNKNNKELVFVTDGALLSKHLSLVKLKILDDSLIYYEKPIYDKKSDYKHPKFKGDEESIVLLSNIADASFHYENPIDLPNDPLDPNKIYSTKIPKLVRLSFKRNNKEYTYIFQVKYNFYTRKDFLRLYRSVE